MLHHITWHQYFTAAIIMAVVYYLWVLIRCYKPELKKLTSRISGNNPDQALKQLQYRGPKLEPAVPPQPARAQTAGQPVEQQDIEQYPAGTEALTSQLRSVIQAAASKPYAPAVLIPQLKKILLDFPGIAASPYRDAINEFIVGECEKTGTALLTEDEVDQWWRD